MSFTAWKQEETNRQETEVVTNTLYMTVNNILQSLPSSDESEPQLELKVFQLGSARDLFDFSWELKLTKNEPKFQFFTKLRSIAVDAE